mgnify:CR=1 FL=1
MTTGFRLRGLSGLSGVVWERKELVVSSSSEPQRALLCVAVILGLLAQGPWASAEPAITAVAGTLADRATMTVTGAGFGIKDPAAPLVWDDGSSDPPLDTHYDGWLPTSAQQGDE